MKAIPDGTETNNILHILKPSRNGIPLITFGRRFPASYDLLHT